MTDQLKNDFDIGTYLSGYGFEHLDARTFINDHEPGRKVKVKLIEPNSAYKCGFQTMAISSVNRRFKKTECLVPQDQERADLIFIPILFGSVKIDRNLNNVVQIQGYVSGSLSGISSDSSFFTLLCHNGMRVQIWFDQRYLDRIIPKRMVHCVVEILPAENGLTVLSLIGLTKLS